MDVRLGLTLLLLLAYSSDIWSKTIRHGLVPSSRYLHYHRHQRQLHRQARALSEFLLPPPVPINFHIPRPLMSPIHYQQKNHNQLPPSLLITPTLSASPSTTQEGYTRDGRYMNQQNGDNNNSPGYFSRLVNCLNPFNSNTHNGNVIGKDSHDQGSLNNLRQQQQIAQYAPLQPYTSGIAQYESSAYPTNLQNGYKNMITWSGKPCNPCNQIPWMPIYRDSIHYKSGQYASNAGSNSYLIPPPAQNIKISDFSHSALDGPTLNYQQNYSIPNSFLYPEDLPPLIKVKPFNDVPVKNLSPTSISLPPLNNDHNSPSPVNNDHNPPPNIENSVSLSFEQALSQNLDYSLPQHFNLPSINLYYQQQPNSDYSSTNFVQTSPSNVNYKPVENFNHPPASSNFDHLSNDNIDNSHLSNINYSPDNSNYSTNYNRQQPRLSPSLDYQVSPNLEYEPSTNLNSQSPSNYDEQYPATNFEQHHESSQIIGIINEPPSDSDNSEINNHQDPDHAESRPVFVNSAASNIDLNYTVNEANQNQFDHRIHYSTSTIITPKQHPEYDETVHFQRSPLIDLSVVGESSTKIPSYELSRELNNRLKDTLKKESVTVTPSKGKAISDNRGSLTPSAVLIDYILSNPNQALDFSEIKKETRSSPRLQHQSERTIVPLSTITSTTSTTQRTTAVPPNQRQQETLIENIVQSYKFYKQQNETRANEGESGNRDINDLDNFSASKEVTMPNQLENGKKNKQIIQIIIPYTSQYTPSPFHTTRSIDDHKKQTVSNSHNSSKTTSVDETMSIRVNPIDDNVEDNIVIQESRHVSVTKNAPDQKLHNNRTNNVTESRIGHTIDVHRLQKNIDNWTIQEYSKRTPAVTNYSNSTHPRWISSKQIPDEYLLPVIELEENEYYDFINETVFQRRINQSKEPTTSENVTKVNIINATYPKNPYKPEEIWKLNDTNSKSGDSERVYVVTPIPNLNSLESLSFSKDRARFRTRNPKVKHVNSVSVEEAYQVLPQAVNNLAVLSNAPNSVAPALWGIMEHEELASSVDQPRWRSEFDVLPDPPSTPILYAGHSKVSRAR